ncbi:late embryogenesis abundant protein Dc3 [Tanacetum coccineum]
MLGNIQDKAQGATETVKNTLGMGGGTTITAPLKKPSTGETIMNAAQSTGENVMNAAQGATETVKNTLGIKKA